MGYQPLKLKLIFAATLAVAVTTLTACSGSTMEPGTPVVPPPTDQHPIQLISETSRLGSPLEQSFADFAVVCWKYDTDDNPSLVMIHDDQTPYQVVWDGTNSKWCYDLTTTDGYEQYLKYWDRAAISYLFVAVAPYNADNTTIDPSTHGVTITNIIGNQTLTPTSDVAVCNFSREVLSATVTRDYDNYPSTPVTVGNPMANHYSSVVPLVFHHLLSEVEVKAYLADEGEAKIVGFKIELEDGATIATKADYEDGSWSYSETTDVVCDRQGLNLTLTATKAEDAATLLDVVEIPQSMAGKEITFIVVLEDGRQIKGTFTLEEGWNSETKYTYYLRLNLLDSYIFMDIDLETHDWTFGGDLEPDEGPVVNW